MKNETRLAALHCCKKFPMADWNFQKWPFFFSKDYLNLETLEPICGFLPAGIRSL